MRYDHYLKPQQFGGIMHVEADLTTTRRTKLYNIQYLRAIAAIMVVIHHAKDPFKGLFNPKLYMPLGEAGVDIFFVISGFIMMTIGVNEPIRIFIWRRFTRIFPLYWIATLAMSMLLISGHSPLNIIDVVKSLLLIPYHNVLYGGKPWPVLVPGWTLTYEIFFYIIFAIALIFKRPLTITLLLLIAAVFAGYIISIDDLAFQLLTRAIILEFVAGMAIAKLYSDGWLRRGASLLPIGVLALCLGIFTEGPRIFCFGVPACAILIGSLALEGAKVRPTLALLGDASYAIYLVHPLALFMLRRIFRYIPLHGWPQLIIFVLISVAASIIAGVLVHLFVEKPIANRLRLKAA